MFYIDECGSVVQFFQPVVCYKCRTLRCGSWWAATIWWWPWRRIMLWCHDDNNHSLEIGIVRDAHFDPSIFLTPLCFVGNNDGSIAALLQDVCRRVSPNDPLQTAKWLFFLLVIHGSIYDVESVALLLRLHNLKIKELEEKFASHAGMNYR